MKISIDKSVISDNAKNIIENVNDIEEYLRQLDDIISNIHLAWSGSDSLKYVDKMKNECINNTKKQINKIKEYGEYLSKIPEVYDLIDEVFSNETIDV